MALKLTIDNLVEGPGTLRDEYKQGSDGKFHLTLDGDPPKLSEFRDRNIVLMKEVEELRPLKAQFDGIDPEAVKADRLKLAELAAKPDAAKLEADLAAERKAHSATQLTNAVVTRFLAMGGRASAVDFIAAEAAKVFAMEDGKLTANEFSPADPASPLSIEEWMQKQMAEKDYVFQPSRGGGARPSSSKFGARSNQRILKNPTPQQLGANATAIAKGDIKVEYSE